MNKKAILTIVGVLILIQLIRPGANKNEAPSPQALTAHYMVPDSVLTALKVACYNCHSNNTAYPWYDQVAPVSWFVAYHVSRGKKHLNFDEFEAYPVKRKLKRLKDISESVEEGTMPISSYTWMHSEAMLTASQKKLIIAWADSLHHQIADTTKAAL
jgi:hypothetical protein